MVKGKKNAVYTSASPKYTYIFSWPAADSELVSSDQTLCQTDTYNTPTTAVPQVLWHILL